MQWTSGVCEESWTFTGWRSDAKSVSLETDVFAQRYALIVVHATIGRDDGLVLS